MTRAGLRNRRTVRVGRFQWGAAAWLGLLAVAADPAAAQSARLTVEAESVRVGAPFTARLVVTGAPGRLVLPSPGAVGRGEVEVVSADASGGATDSVDLRLAVFALDSVDVVLPVAFVAGAETTRVQTPPVRVRVIRLVADSTARLRPTLPPEGFGWPPWVWAVLAAVVAFLIWLWRRSRRRTPPVPPPPTTEPVSDPGPRARLDRQLDDLAATLPVSTEDARRWSAALTDALRTYLAERHGYATREMTTADLVRTVGRGERQRRHASGSAPALRHVLDVADLGRYGGVRPPDAALREALSGTAAVADALNAPAPAPAPVAPVSASPGRPGTRAPLPTVSPMAPRPGDAPAVPDRSPDAYRPAGQESFHPDAVAPESVDPDPFAP